MIGLDTATTGMHEVVLKPAKKVMADTGFSNETGNPILVENGS